MAVRIIDVFNQFLDDAGDPLAGGKVYTYVGTSSTPLATYTEATGVTAHANPIILDSDGRPPSPIHWTIGSAYKARLATSGDVFLDTVITFTVPDTSAATASLYADFEFEYPGGPPVAAGAGTTAGWIGGRRVARAVSFLANFSGSYGFALTAPAASFVATVRKNATLNDNGTQIGTITVATDKTYTFATTTGATQSLAAGDTLHVFGPVVADTAIADFGFTLAGSLT